MILCVFSDIHGNRLYFDFLSDAWKEMEIDRFFFLGDAIGYFPDGNEVLDRLKEFNPVCIKGNHEAMLLGLLPLSDEKDEVYHLKEQKANLTEENLSFLNRWPDAWKQDIDGLRIHFVHGTISDPLTGYGYENSDFANFDQTGLDVLFIGQTHRPWIRRNKHTLIVNVGSIGLPRDYGNQPSFVLFDTKTKAASIWRVEIDPGPILDHPEGIHPSVVDVLKRT